jgi:parallel beta-helix repeat protein
VLVGVALLLPPSQAAAVNFFVRASGDDSRDGRSPGTAVATIRRAAGKAGGGDAVVVGPGRYAEGEIIPAGNGRRHELMRFIADTDGSLTGDPPGEVLVDATGFEVGFRIASRPWVVIRGFSVANATEEGIAIKSSSDHSVVADCQVFSNRGRGVWVRDSTDVILFNNLIYDNGISGVDFGGEGDGSARGVVLNNTVYANALDGVRIEGLVSSPRAMVVQNVIAQNLGRGLNVKTKSADGFVGQWNLNIDGYGSEAVQAAFDLTDSPLLVAPPGADLVLGGLGHADDDFRLRQRVAGQTEDSTAVDASPFSATSLGLSHGSTESGGMADAGRADLGFHYGNKTDFVSALKGSLKGRVSRLRSRASKCQRLGTQARVERVRCIARPDVLRRLQRTCALKTLSLCP